MALSIHFSATGVEDTELAMLGMSHNFEDASPVLRSVAAMLRESEKALFATEDEWAPLAESTVAYKAAHGLGDKILQATGEMMRSLTEERHGGHIEHVTPTELIFGTSDDKAGFHRSGTSRMPKRDPLEVTEVHEKTIQKMIQAFIVGAERDAFGLPGSYSTALTNPFGI